ncbi:MAG: DUF4276 family protein [Nitrospinota bacterium]|nr:DUF4276 family protein [Nitrospinota bacterium]
MKELVFLLEEPSARAMLEGFLPKLLRGKINVDCYATYIIFEGKRDLDANLSRKVKLWRKPNSHFIVIRDTDSGPCEAILNKLKSISKSCKKKNILIRLAITELESWYLGDLAAVEKGLGVVNLSKRQSEYSTRKLDRLQMPSRRLSKLVKGKYQKVAGSRAIGPHLSLTDNRSSSFHKFMDGIRAIV